MKKIITASIIAILAATLAGCDLFDPHPSDSEVGQAIADISSGITSVMPLTGGLVANAVPQTNYLGSSLVITSTTATITYSSYKNSAVGSYFTVNGTITYTLATSSNPVVRMTGNLTLTSNSSTVKSLTFTDLVANGLTGLPASTTAAVKVNKNYNYVWFTGKYSK
jgi:hypothetical protein